MFYFIILACISIVLSPTVEPESLSELVMQLSGGKIQYLSKFEEKDVIVAIKKAITENKITVTLTQDSLGNKLTNPTNFDYELEESQKDFLIQALCRSNLNMHKETATYFNELLLSDEPDDLKSRLVSCLFDSGNLDMLNEYFLNPANSSTVKLRIVSDYTNKNVDFPDSLIPNVKDVLIASENSRDIDSVFYLFFKELGLRETYAFIMSLQDANKQVRGLNAISSGYWFYQAEIGNHIIFEDKEWLFDQLKALPHQPDPGVRYEIYVNIFILASSFDPNGIDTILSQRQKQLGLVERVEAYFSEIRKSEDDNKSIKLLDSLKEDDVFGKCRTEISKIEGPK